jgi:hypothetical protein
MPGSWLARWSISEASVIAGDDVCGEGPVTPSKSQELQLSVDAFGKPPYVEDDRARSDVTAEEADF